MSEPPHKTPVTSILRRDASREAHGHEIPRRDLHNKVNKKFSRPKRPPTNILQVKLQQQQVWMGQLLDFVFRHGGLQQDVSAPCPNDECGTSRAVQYIRDGLPLGLNAGAPSDDDPISGKSLGRSCFTGRGGSCHPPNANGIVSHNFFCDMTTFRCPHTFRCRYGAGNRSPLKPLGSCPCSAHTSRQTRLLGVSDPPGRFPAGHRWCSPLPGCTA